MKTLLSVVILSLAVIPVLSQNSPESRTDHPNVHKIVVKEVLQTTSYTYVQAEENGELQWIAIPKMDAKVGEEYYYYGGTQMGEFKSKELDRTFSAILFLNGLVKPELVEGGGTALTVSNQKSEASIININEPIVPAEGGITIAELYANKEKYANEIVKVRAKVTKYNTKIMGRNWIHIQDSPANQGKIDLTVTTTEEARVGDIICMEGRITLDKDFGAGYFYSIIMEDGRIVEQSK